MNPVEKAVRKVDAAQRRHTPTAFLFGVVKKTTDDNGGSLVGNLTYTTFISLFPLLLILVSILGLIARADPSVRTDTLNAVAKRIPLIGNTLTENVHQLQESSTIGLIVGLVLLAWGTTSLAQAGVFTMEQVWNLPGPARPGYFPRLGRAVIFLSLLGAGVIVTTGLTVLNSYATNTSWWGFVAEILAAAFNVGMYIGAFRVLTPKGVPTHNLMAGAITGGILWTLVQYLGTYVVQHFLGSDSAYGIFATVLALLAWIYLECNITVYSAEINVVLARRLWPRAIVQPPLTEADRHVMALQALQNQRRPEQQVTVTFSDREPGARTAAQTPRTPDEVTPPGNPQVPRQRPAADSASVSDRTQ